MQIEEFTLERIQSLYENLVEFNLSDSGVHPYSLKELLAADQLLGLHEVELGYGWTNGGVELRDTIARLYNGRDRDNVMVTNGSAEANFILVMTVLEPGDELVLFVPNYLQIRGWAKALGVTVKEIVLREEMGWLPDLDEVRAAVTPKTKMISLCNPNNPTGSLLPRETMDALVDIARDHDVYLHADEIYKGSELDTEESVSFADLYEKAVVTAGLSKAMALPGLRLGWLVGPAKEIYGTWQRKDYTSITTGALSEHIANIVLQPAKRAEILSRSRHLLRENRTLLTSWIETHNNLFSYLPPRAGGMAFVRYNRHINSSVLVDRVREQKSVMLVPGDVYGLDGYVRIGIGAQKHHLKAGLERFADFMRG
jgi:aspartate/methionine/tyrosine aminotransferase